MRHPLTVDLAAKADLFVQKGLTGYDACYAALAFDLKGCWITFDGKAHQSIKTLDVSFSLADGLPPRWHQDWNT